jgi:phenylacetate-CoA oxygenase PaaH subunit
VKGAEGVPFRSPGHSNRWEVAGRRRAGDDFEPVGYVHAPDAEMALLLAKESFFRHGEGVDLRVARDGEVRVLADPDLLTFATDKSYKLQRGYTGLGDKRRRAVARARSAGAVRAHSRPVDLRVLNEDHRDR